MNSGPRPLVLLLGLVLCVSGCASSSTFTSPTPSVPPPPQAFLASLRISLASASPVIGQGDQITVTGTDQNGKAIQVTVALTYASSNTAVAAVSSSGLIQALAAGSATITVSAPNTPPVTAVVNIAPLAQTVTFPAPTPGAMFLVSATSSSGLPVVFSSVTPTTCSVSGTMVTELLSGICTIEADQPGNSIYAPAPLVTQTVNIGQKVGAISVTPANTTVDPGISATFTASALDQFNQPMLGATFTWTGANNGVVVGQNSTQFPVTQQITAHAGGVTSAPASLTVNPAAPILTTATLSPSTATISAPSGIQQFSVAEQDQFGRPMNPFVTCSYSSSNLAAATINSSGTATSQNTTPNTVTTNIVALCGGMTTNSVVLTVLAQKSFAAKLVVTDAQVQQSLSTSVSVIALDEFNQPFPIGQIDVDAGFDATVISAVAQNNEGNQVLIGGLKVGTTQVTVHIDTDDSVMATFNVTVVPCLPGICYTPILTTINVTGETQSMDFQGTQEFTAQGIDQKGGGFNTTFTWASTNTSAVVIDPVSGIATAVGPGTAAIQATSAGVTGTSLTITVVPVTPVAISIATIFPTVAAVRLSRAESITINGTGFNSGAVVNFGSDSTPANTVFKSSTQLIVTVPASDLNVTTDTVVPITVTNALQPGATTQAISNSVSFLITTKGMVSITFDDAFQSTYDNGIPIFDAAGIKVTEFVITGNYNKGLRSDGYPWGWNNNNCPTVSPAPTVFNSSCFVGVGATNYMTWDEVHTLASHGHEIGAHTRSHNSLSILSAADQLGEIQGAKDDLAANGLTVHTMAYPYGDYGCLTQTASQTTCATVAGNGTGSTAQTIGTLVKGSGYRGARSSDIGFEGDTSGNPAGNLPLYLASQTGDVTPGDAMTTAQLIAIVDAAMTKGAWVIFLFHRVDEPCRSDLCVAPQVPNAISIDSTSLQGLASYLTTKGIRTATVNEGLAIEGLNGQTQILVFPTE